MLLGGLTMSGAERFFIGLTVVGFAMLLATLSLAGLIWVGAIAGN